MKFETLNSGKSRFWKRFCLGFSLFVIALFGIFTIYTSFAKYKVVSSVKLAEGTINYSRADFSLIGIKQQEKNEDGSGKTIEGGEGKEYKDVTDVPTDGYEFNDEATYCTIGDDVHVTGKTALLAKGITITYDSATGLVFSGIKKTNTKCYVYFDVSEKGSSGKTLGNLGIQDDVIEVSKESFSDIACGTCSDSTSGLFKGTDDDGETYYYRGNVSNNWVKFANMYWRIIRINGDGTIRLIYSGEGSASTTGTGTAINGGAYVKFNDVYNDNKYVGYMYDGAKNDASTEYKDTMSDTVTNSTILDTIKTWYEDKFKNKEYQDKIDGNAGFCGDRSLAKKSHGGSYTLGASRGYGANVTAYGPADRAWAEGGTGWASSITPTFNCENQNRDLYTTNDAKRGNKKLPVPVGLITMDEVIFAGGYPGKANNGTAPYYLYTNQYYWTMSPAIFNGSYARVFCVNSNGSLSNDYVDSAYGVRPVINLKADTRFSNVGGAEVTLGTMAKPYEVA